MVQVYCTAYDPFLEQDVQDVFITSLALANGVLSVVDEKGRQFQISTTTRVVTGATGGCIRQGCSSAPVSAAGERPEGARAAPVALRSLE